jgi:hypothetical protein
VDQLKVLADAAPIWAPDSVSWAEPTEDHDPPFPTHSLPSRLRNIAEDVAAATQTPTALAGSMAIAAVSVVTAKKVRVDVGSYTLPVNIYTLMGMPSGSGKDPATQMICSPLSAIEQEMQERERDRVAQNRNRHEVLKRRIERQQRRLANSDNEDAETILQAAIKEMEELPHLTLPRLFVDDATSESVDPILAANNGRLAVLTAEGGGLVQIWKGRYLQPNQTGNIEVWLKGADGTEHRVDRQGRRVYVPEPTITIGMAVQPSVLHDVSDESEFRARGLVSRFFFAMPRAFFGSRNPHPPRVRVEVAADWANLLRRLNEIEPAEIVKGQWRPHILRLSPEATELFDAYWSEVESELDPAGRYAEMTDFGSKMQGRFPRLAGLLHMAGEENPLSVPISGSTMENAIHLARYYMGQAERVLKLMGAGPNQDGVVKAVAIFRKRQWERFTKKDLYERMRTRTKWKRAQDIDPVLTRLLEMEYVKEEGAGSYVVRPSLLMESATQEEVEW